MKDAVFLDRDGVINKNMAEHDYVKNWSEFEWLPDIKQAILLINKSGKLAIIISNQRGVARGHMTSDVVEDIHNKMNEELSKTGAKIDAIYWCGHDYGDDCECRKPKPGLILQAAKDFDIDLANSWMIGDGDSDIEAGKNAGCKTIMMERDGSLYDVVAKLLSA